MLEMLEPLKFAVKYLIHPKYFLGLIDFTQQKNWPTFQMRPTGEFIKKLLIRI